MSSGSARLFVVMGVSGCGKSSIGKGIAAKLGGSYLEGDDLHPPQNIELMSSGVPLTDEDRWPWLASVAGHMAASEGLLFTGCSALRKAYRSFLIGKAGEPVLFIHLHGSKELIASRMGGRTGHFMPTDLLESQFQTLELPDASEASVTVDISKTEDEIVTEIVTLLKSRNDPAS